MTPRRVAVWDCPRLAVYSAVGALFAGHVSTYASAYVHMPREREREREMSGVRIAVCAPSGQIAGELGLLY